MSEILLHPEAARPAAAPEGSGLTPAGLQSARALTRRRVFVAALNLLTLGLLSLALIRIFGAGGWSAAGIVIFICFLFGAPWTVIGFWNAMIGLWLLHGARDGLAATSPFLADGESGAAIATRTAIAMALRNEDAERALSKTAATKRSLDETGFGDRFDIFVLSDTDDPAHAEAEESAFERRRKAFGPGARYRRRARNTGFKGGNLRDFLRRWGAGYEFFLPLDSDSRMSGAASAGRVSSGTHAV